MSRSSNQKSIPHRYRKGKDGGVRKSPNWDDNKKTKKDNIEVDYNEWYGEDEVS